MYTFAVIALLAIATVKLVDYLTDAIPQIAPVKSLLTFVAAIGAVLALNFSMFTGWGVEVRNETLGIWMTGFSVAGMTVAWRAAFGYLTHDRATADETLGEHRTLRKAA